MASTISINFASAPEVFSVDPPTKKSISAKVLRDILGGGGDGGSGYVRREGDVMEGYLSLPNTPITPNHAVPKFYVDERAIARRYKFTLKNTTAILSGADDNGTWLTFFKGDAPENSTFSRFLDVYRNGILQVWGPDFSFRNLTFNQDDIALRQLFPHTIQLSSPAPSGSVIQITIGTVGSLPYVTGVAALTAYEPGDVRGTTRGSGIRVRRTNIYFPDGDPTPPTGDGQIMGDLALSAAPADFAALAAEVQNPQRNDVVLTPFNLISYPLMPKAFALYRRQNAASGPPLWPDGTRYTRQTTTQKYGAPNGMFHFVKGYNLGSLISGVGSDAPEVFTCTLSSGIFTGANPSYTPVINIGLTNSGTIFDEHCVAFVANNSRVTTPTPQFKFTVLNFAFAPPADIDEIGIIVY